MTARLAGRARLPGAELHLRPERRLPPGARCSSARCCAGWLHRGIAAFVDDDDEVVETALAAGFPAVLADWVPRSETLRDAQERPAAPESSRRER